MKQNQVEVMIEGVPERDSRGRLTNLSVLATNTPGHRDYDVFLNGEMVDMMTLRYADSACGMVVLLVRSSEPSKHPLAINYSQQTIMNGHSRRVRFNTEIVYGVVEIKLRDPQ